MTGLQATAVKKPGVRLMKSEHRPRTLDDVLSEGSAAPCEHKAWCARVDGQVEAALSRPGVLRERMESMKRKIPCASSEQLEKAVRAEVRAEVLANDRAYWM